MTSMTEHPVPSELLTRIGDMTVSFAVLELYIQMLLSALVGEDERVGQIIASQLPFARLRATVVGLYGERHGDDDDLRALKQLMNEAGQIEEERNRITHSIWGADASPGKITRMKLTCGQKRGLQVQSKEYDEAKFIDFNNRIKRLSSDVFGFYTRLLQKGKPVNSAAERSP